MKNQSGFTLIELLIVIALLGALAVGLLASIDPLEQFKKGTDTGVRNTVAEIQAAATRYYSTAIEYPWGTLTGTGVAADGSAFKPYITSMVNAGELKADFLELSSEQLKNIYVTYNKEKITVCFQPGSKSFRADKSARYDSAGGTLAETTCPNGTSSLCHWCVK